MKLNFKALAKSDQTGFFVIDLFMILLVMINLVWMSLDWFFTSQLIKDMVAELTPVFFEFYATHIHPNFLIFDGIFVTIFLFELLVRWALAVKRKTFHKWFFYPFVHWYDVLGCVPLGTFRFLRLLRVFSMAIRLQKLGVVDFKDNFIYEIIKKYYEILVEEVSDRVVVNVLDDIKTEVTTGSPVTDKMMAQVIQPHKKALVEWMANRVKRVTAHHYELHKEEIKAYLERLVKGAVAKNKEMKEVRKIPLVGGTIASSIESAIGDITFSVVNGAIGELASDEDNAIIQEITDIAFDTVMMEDEDKELNRIAVHIAAESIELMKEQVRIQQWKVREEQKKEVKTRAREIAKIRKQGAL